MGIIKWLFSDLFDMDKSIYRTLNLDNLKELDDITFDLPDLRYYCSKYEPELWNTIISIAFNNPIFLCEINKYSGKTFISSDSVITVINELVHSIIKKHPEIIRKTILKMIVQ